MAETSHGLPKDFGALVATGKTKDIYASKGDPYVGYVRSKDRVTWLDTYQIDMVGKGEWSTTTTCHVFEFLRSKKLPVALLGHFDQRTFVTELCEMFPFEVVTIGVVAEQSSYRKRHPRLVLDTELLSPPTVFHLKTSGRTYHGRALPCDDPVVEVVNEWVRVYLPGKPIEDQIPIFSVPFKDAEKEFPGFAHLAVMASCNTKVFLHLSSKVSAFGGRLYDLKCEYGRALRPELGGKVLLADVIDADSWRLTVHGKRADKQVIRDLGEPGVAEQELAYRLAVEASASLFP